MKMNRPPPQIVPSHSREDFRRHDICVHVNINNRQKLWTFQVLQSDSSVIWTLSVSPVWPNRSWWHCLLRHRHIKCHQFIKYEQTQTEQENRTLAFLFALIYIFKKNMTQTLEPLHISKDLWLIICALLMLMRMQASLNVFPLQPAAR